MTVEARHVVRASIAVLTLVAFVGGAAGVSGAPAASDGAVDAERLEGLSPAEAAGDGVVYCEPYGHNFIGECYVLGHQITS